MSAESLNYGSKEAGAYMLGHPKFLSVLADFLTGQYGVKVEAKNLMSTGGASMGIDVACRVHCPDGGICVVEEPTYFLSFTICRNNGMSLLGVPMEEDGMDVNALEKLCKENPGKIKMVYTVPINHNPSGYTMSNEKRQKLVDLAKQYNFVICAD